MTVILINWVKCRDQESVRKYNLRKEKKGDKECTCVRAHTHLKAEREGVSLGLNFHFLSFFVKSEGFSAFSVSTHYFFRIGYF